MADEVYVLKAFNADELGDMLDDSVHCVVCNGFRIAGVALTETIDRNDMRPLGEVIEIPAPVYRAVGCQV
jgi:hypothetical protein